MGFFGRQRVRVGVIGLGRLWEARHKPALANLRDRVQVVAVYDHVARRAAIEAASLRCLAAPGLSALIQRPDVDAIYLLTPQWFGLHPVAIAAAAGKPVYCALPPSASADDLERLAPAIRSSGIAFVPELARRFYPASVRLRALLDDELGRPRLILGHSRLFGFDRYGAPGPSTQLAPVPLTVDPGSYLLDWARFVFGAEPSGLTGTEGVVLPGSSAPDDADFLDVGLTFPGGGMARLSVSRYHRDPWGDAPKFLPSPGFQVFAERGVAWLEMPDRVAWSGPGGTRDERMPMEPTVGEALNDQFLRRVLGEPSTAPTLDDALAVVRMERDLKRALDAGRAASTEG